MHQEATVMPEIVKTIPEDYAAIGGSTQILKAIFVRHDKTTSNRMKIEYYDDEEEKWIVIADDINSITYISKDLPLGKNYNAATFEWDLSKFTEQKDIRIKYTVYDSGMNEQSVERTYRVDREVPNAILDLVVEENNGVPVFSWSPLDKNVCSGYRLYRRKKGNSIFTIVADITGYNNHTCFDANGKEGVTYEYVLRAIDEFEQESSDSNCVEVTISEDEETPELIRMTPISSETLSSDEKILLYGKDNKKIYSGKLVITDESGSITEITSATFDSENTIILWWDTSQYADGKYNVKAYLYDEKGNESNYIERNYVLDNTGPSKVVLTKCEVNRMTAYLSWENVGSDAESYIVQKLVDETWRTAGTIKGKLYYEIDNLIPETTYSYRVYACDEYGNAGEASEVWSFTTEKDTQGPVITAVGPADGKTVNNLYLAMEAMDDVELAKGVFSYSVDGLDYQVIKNIEVEDVTNTRFTTSFVTTDIPEGDLYVKFEAYDAYGNKNNLLNNEDIVCVYHIDHTPPEPVTELECSSDKGAAVLKWNDVEADKYYVYRSLSKEGNYRIVGEVTQTTYTDATVEEYGKYYYKICAVDEAGNMSECTEPLSVQIKKDELAPKMLSLSPNKNQIYGPDTYMQAVATDNAMLSKIVFEYKEKESDEWILLEERPVSGTSGYASSLWTDNGIKENTEYVLRAKAIDKSGNESEYTEETCWFDFTPPEAPTVSVAKKGNGLEITYSNNEESDFGHYEIYRKAYEDNDDFRCIITTGANDFFDENVEAGKLYLYKVVAVDKYGNESISNQVGAYAEAKDITNPMAICAEKMTGVVGKDVCFDGLLSYDNERISKFEWEFGDGTTSTQSCPNHCYDSAGTYNVKLTVTDANGNEDTAYGMVVVSEETLEVGTVTFRVTDLNGNAIDSVYATIREKEITLTTGSDGKVEFVAEAGTYHVAFESNEYRLSEIMVEVEAGTDKTVDVSMCSRSAVDATWDIQKMSYDEIVAADIDLSNPENYFTCKYTIELYYENEKNPSVWISYDTYSSSAPSLPTGPVGKTNKVKETPCYQSKSINDEPARMVTCDNFRALILPMKCQTISWLKNMYSARLEVCNISEGGTTLYDVNATIDLQEGLALAGKTSGKQNATKYIGALGQEESQIVEWQIRGDAPGDYTISGLLSGVFGDTGQPFSTCIRGDLKVHEQHTEGLHLYVRPEGRGYLDESYYVQYELVNESSQTFYQVTTHFGETQTINRELIVEVIQGGKVIKTERTDGNVSYYLPRANDAGSIPTLSGGSVTVGELKPEQRITGTYVSKFKGGGPRYYKQFVDAFVDQVSGFNADITITVLPTQSHIDKWQVFLPTMKLATGYKRKSDSGSDSKFQVAGGQTTDPSEDTEDPVNMMTGAFYTSQNLMSVSGVRDLAFEINYESTKTDEKGMLGYGWHHAYESFVKDESGLVQLYLNPQDKITFVKESVKKNTVQGTYEDGVVTVLPIEEKDETYVVLHDYYVGYTMTKNETGYAVTLPDGTVNLYDIDGKLVRTTNLYGQNIVFSYTEDSYTIEDEASGKTIVAQKDETGKLTALTDPSGNTVQFTYDAQENLVAIKNKRGYSMIYAYSDHKLTQARDAEERLYLVNTYDEQGRVLTQDDGREDTPVATFTYEEDEETGNLSIHITGRNGGQQDVISDVRGNGVKYTNSLGGIKTYTYDDNGNMTSSTFTDGKTEYYSYDVDGNLIQIKDSATGVCNYAYNKNRQVTEYNDSSGNSEKYYYNEKNLMIKEVANGVSTTYTYNENGQKLSAETEGKGMIRYTYDDSGNQTSITYPDGSKDSFTYDAIGNVVGYTNRKGIVTEYEIDPNGHVLSESVLLSDGEKAVTLYTYDPYGNMISQTDANGNKTTYNYDVDGNCIKEIRADGSAISYCYDTDGNITSIAYPDGTTTQTAVYDTAGNLKQIVDALSQITTGDYNSASQLIKTTQADGGIVTYEYYGNGLLKRQTDAEGNTTTYIYDEAERVTSVTSPNGNTATITYDSYGNMNAVTDGEGNTVTISYNAFGEMVATTDANGNKTTFVYDSMGNCVSMTDALGNMTEYTYDAIGQIMAVTQKGKNSEDISISYSYDNLGNITSVTDGEGNTFRMTYDKVGNVTAVYDAYDRLVESYTYDNVYNQMGITDGNGARILYSYDSMGNKIKTLNESNGSVTTYSYIGGNLISAATDALGGKTSATYDTMGNLASFTNPNGGVSSYTYDKNQNVTSESVGDYYNVKYTYDKNGNVKSMTNSRGQVTTYEYDKADRVIKQTDEAGIIAYTYDANGNKLKVTETVSGKTVSANTITRTYDALNRVTSYTDAEGNTIKYNYDEFGNIISVIYPGSQKVDYTYDKNGNILTVTDWNDRVISYSYDKNGRLIKTVRPDGSKETRTYDKAGNLISLKDITKDGTVINDYTYNYNLSGNITAICDKSAGTENQQTDKETTAQMEYDSVNRLIKYNGKEVKYDADGNMIYGPLDGEMADFTYDCRNRLIEVKTDSGKTTKYIYDAENIRTKVVKNAGTKNETVTTYVTDSVSDDLSRVLQSETVDKNGMTETIWYTYGKGLISQEKGAEYLLYHFDHLGSTTAVTDAGGEIKYTYAYTIFGKLLRGNYEEVEFLYNGKYGVTSDANGLYYMRARYYNINIMRFINQDILTGSIDSSQSLNRYAYVEGNPVNFLDPFGLCPSEDNNDDLHDFYDKAGVWAFRISVAAAIVGIVATGPISVAALSAATIFSEVGIGILAVDNYLYYEDVKSSSSGKERMEAYKGIDENNKSMFLNLVLRGPKGKIGVKLSSEKSKAFLDLVISIIENEVTKQWGE